MAVKDERTRGKPDPAPAEHGDSGYREQNPKGRREAVVGAEPVARERGMKEKPPAPSKPKDSPA